MDSEGYISSASTLSCLDSITSLDAPLIQQTDGEFVIVKQLSDAKFSVYLVQSTTNQLYYAMKIFPYSYGEASPFFLNEIRFLNLQHPNILAPVHFEDGLTQEDQKFSYSISEFAPLEDFFNLVVHSNVRFDEKLVRTYFHQLIEGLEYLQSKDIAHLDLKLENMMLGKDFQLKIIDFDMSCFRADTEILSRGTVDYRAPEVEDGSCMMPYAADVFSAGIILFLLKSGGVLPYNESDRNNNNDMFGLLQQNYKKFWKTHTKIQGRDVDYWSDEFKFLFMWMTRADPKERPSLQQVKKSKWYVDPIYSPEQLRIVMGSYLGNNSSDF
jgi:serine/threonine protein kinase